MKHVSHLTSFQRYSLWSLTWLLLIHVFVLHNHLLTPLESQSPTTDKVESSCHCCPSQATSNDENEPASGCQNCCHCEFDAKIHNIDFIASSVEFDNSSLPFWERFTAQNTTISTRCRAPPAPPPNAKIIQQFLISSIQLRL